MTTFILLLARFGFGLRRAATNPGFVALVITVVLLIFSGTLFYHKVEGWSFVDAYYFSVITLTTVGYGDLTPLTVLGKVFTTIYLFVGIGIILAFINEVAKHATHESPLPEFLKRQGIGREKSTTPKK